MGLTHQSLIKKMHPQACLLQHDIVGVSIFSIEIDSLLSDDSSLYQVDIKLASTETQAGVVTNKFVR